MGQLRGTIAPRQPLSFSWGNAHEPVHVGKPGRSRQCTRQGTYGGRTRSVRASGSPTSRAARKKSSSWRSDSSNSGVSKPAYQPQRPNYPGLGGAATKRLIARLRSAKHTTKHLVSTFLARLRKVDVHSYAPMTTSAPATIRTCSASAQRHPDEPADDAADAVPLDSRCLHRFGFDSSLHPAAHVRRPDVAKLLHYRLAVRAH